MSVIAIDPGTTRSAWVCYDGFPRAFGIEDNTALLERLGMTGSFGDILVIERIASYGMPVGDEVFETVFWSGRFAQAWGRDWTRITRREVKLHLCGSARAKDANIRQALIDRFGGKEAAIGRKAAPGPLHGISKDVWAALAVAVTFADMEVQQ